MGRFEISPAFDQALSRVALGSQTWFQRLSMSRKMQSPHPVSTQILFSSTTLSSRLSKAKMPPFLHPFSLFSVTYHFSFPSPKEHRTPSLGLSATPPPGRRGCAILSDGLTLPKRFQSPIKQDSDLAFCNIFLYYLLPLSRYGSLLCFLASKRILLAYQLWFLSLLHSYSNNASLPRVVDVSLCFKTIAS